MPYLMLISRLLLFAFFQGCIAVFLQSWAESEKYWLLTATLTNIVSIVLLVLLFRRQGGTYLSIFRFNKSEWKKDVLIFAGLTILSIPLVLFPPLILSKWLWGTQDYYEQVLFQPVSTGITYVMLVAFPVSIALAELATYFGYVMPKIYSRNKVSWIAVLLPVIFLSLQHATLPLVFDAEFIVFRALMYLPFALLLGVAIFKRPSLLLYFAVLHGLMDFSTVIMYLIKTR